MIEAFFTDHTASPLLPCLLLIVLGLLLNSHPIKSRLSLPSNFTSKLLTLPSPQAPTGPTARETLNFAAIEPVTGLPPLTTPPNWPRYWKPGKFQMTMALRKLDINNWLNYDRLFDAEHADKLAMVRGPHPELYVDYLDGVDDAVLELLETVVQYVTTRFPDMFRADGEYIYIDHLKEKYRITEPFDAHPLAVTGLLVHDDVYVLKRGPRRLPRVPIGLAPATTHRVAAAPNPRPHPAVEGEAAEVDGAILPSPQTHKTHPTQQPLHPAPPRPLPHRALRQSGAMHRARAGAHPHGAAVSLQAASLAGGGIHRAHVRYAADGSGGRAGRARGALGPCKAFSAGYCRV
ncbi:uncharacterized protein DSM5745_05941 [Aspergillus mulundensis]|uniref:Uncharacterized protein n=1 Tax=Aspergillus mulundensis TaxID=1810919 RepID=A0A3D8RYF8_9EURO|nr:hypothetical protein DSM5745_05941 [Aspergillus mulundensis]RDW79089.1 hypothetical protein DSM5745_05941 [Aspergillus mulundensis]